MGGSGGNHYTLVIAGETVPLALRHSSRARRFLLRVDPADGAVRVTLPEGVPAFEGLRFAERHLEWIAQRRAALPEARPFEPGVILPILGVEHCIHHAEWARRGVWRESGIIWVSGRREHLARRVADFLKAEARRAVTASAIDKAAKVARAVRRISLRDTRSRWGSCTAAGDLSFSWRLILAPEIVLDYVVAHEVAHLVYLDHSPAFWQVVERLAEEPRAARRWLRREGSQLWRYG